MELKDLLDAADAERSAAFPAAVGAVDASADNAARAFELSRSSGVPAVVIHGDLENFERTQRAKLASDLVEGNPRLGTLLTSHPLAPAVTNDDLGTLDQTSQAVSGFALKERGYSLITTPGAVLSAAVSGFSKGFGPSAIGSWTAEVPLIRENRLGTLMWGALASPIEGAFRIGSGAMHAATEAAKTSMEHAYDVANPGGRTVDLGEGFYLPPKSALSRDLAGLIELQLMGVGGVHAPHPAMAKAGKAAEPWLNHGMEPFAGVSPILDGVKIEAGIRDIDALAHATQVAQQSLTRQRAPELFKPFIEQHGTGSIGITAEAATKNAADLAWVPDLQAKIAIAHKTGSDVKVPISDWLTYVTPEAAQKLWLDIRVSEGGVTMREVEKISTRVPPVRSGEEDRRSKIIPPELNPEINPIDTLLHESHGQRLWENAAARGETPTDTVAVRRDFDAVQVREHSPRDYLEAAYRAELADDPLRAHTAWLYAQEARDLENGVTSFRERAERLSVRLPDGIDPAYVPALHAMLRAADEFRGVASVAERPLVEFFEARPELGRMPEFLEAQPQRIPEMTAGKFWAIDEALASLEAAATIPADFATRKAALIKQLETFSELRELGPALDAAREGKQASVAAMVQMEALFRRWDRGTGPWAEVIRPLIRAQNHFDAVMKTYGDAFPKQPTRGTVVNPIFRDPATQRLLPSTRDTLHSVMLNAKDPLRLERLAKEQGTTPQAITEWINRSAKAEDHAFVDGVHESFRRARDEANADFTHATGIERPPTAEGWYPLIEHTSPEGRGQIILDTKRVPIVLRQMVHGYTMRQTLADTGRVFRDADIRSTISARMGKPFVDLLDPYLRDVGMREMLSDPLMEGWARASDTIRRNLITNLIGFNPGTVIKHGSTAFINSFQEVGAKAFAKELVSMLEPTTKGESGWAFAHRVSEEIQRRHANYTEIITGGEPIVRSLRDTIAHWSTTPVSISDKFSAIPTWLAKYKQEIARGTSEARAILEADAAVRRAHGTIAVTSKSAVMRSAGAAGRWFTSLYSTWNHIWNRQWETLWRMGEVRGVARREGKAAAMKEAQRVGNLVFGYWVIPGLVHEMVAGGFTNPDESWSGVMGKAVASSAMGPLVIVRDLIYAFTSGRDPTGSLPGSAMKFATDLPRTGIKIAQDKEVASGTMFLHAAEMGGLITGLPLLIPGKAAKFTANVKEGKEQPKNLWDWTRGLAFGTIKSHH